MIEMRSVIRRICIFPLFRCCKIRAECTFDRYLFVALVEIPTRERQKVNRLIGTTALVRQKWVTDSLGNQTEVSER